MLNLEKQNLRVYFRILHNQDPLFLSLVHQYMGAIPKKDLVCRDFLTWETFFQPSIN